DINSLQGIVLMPWVMAASTYYVLVWRSKKPQVIRRGLVILALAWLLQFLSSHPQYSYYTWLVSLSYVFLFLPTGFKNKIMWTAVPFGLFLGLPAIQLLPFLELSEQAYRPKELEFSSQNALEIWDMPRFILGGFYGSWVEG